MTIIEKFAGIVTVLAVVSQSGALAEDVYHALVKSRAVELIEINKAVVDENFGSSSNAIISYEARVIKASTGDGFVVDELRAERVSSNESSGKVESQRTN